MPNDEQQHCTVSDCPLPYFDDGKCIEHFYEWRAKARLRGPVERIGEAFWKRVERTDACWFWTGKVHQGYGKFHVTHKRAVLAHRLSWELTNGPIPKKLFVCHKCDVRGCVRPDHLFLGDAFDNAGDMVLKGYTSHANSEKVIFTRAQIERLAMELGVTHEELERAIRIVKYGRDKPSNLDSDPRAG
jgi:hypothetical protein